MNKELTRKMIKFLFFTNRNSKVGFKINLDTHHINHASSKLINTPNYPKFGIETRYFNRIIKDLSVIHARLINQYIFKNQTVFSARLDKQDGDNHLLDETELFTNFKTNHKLTESDLDRIDIKSPLQHQIQQHDMKNSEWRFDKIISSIV